MGGALKNLFGLPGQQGPGQYEAVQQPLQGLMPGLFAQQNRYQPQRVQQLQPLLPFFVPQRQQTQTSQVILPPVQQYPQPQRSPYPTQQMPLPVPGPIQHQPQAQNPMAALLQSPPPRQNTSSIKAMVPPPQPVPIPQQQQNPLAMFNPASLNAHISSNNNPNANLGF